MTAGGGGDAAMGADGPERKGMESWSGEGEGIPVCSTEGAAATMRGGDGIGGKGAIGAVGTSLPEAERSGGAAGSGVEGSGAAGAADEASVRWRSRKACV
jgi:hypothetical protein